MLEPKLLVVCLCWLLLLPWRWAVSLAGCSHARLEAPSSPKVMLPFLWQMSISLLLIAAFCRHTTGAPSMITRRGRPRSVHILVFFVLSPWRYSSCYSPKPSAICLFVVIECICGDTRFQEQARLLEKLAACVSGSCSPRAEQPRSSSPRSSIGATNPQLRRGDWKI